MKDETDSSSEEEDSETDEGYADAEYTNSSEDDADDEEEWFLSTIIFNISQNILIKYNTMTFDHYCNQ